MHIIDETLNGIILLEPRVYDDERGYFLESYNKKKFEKIGLTETFVQDNISRSKKQTMRGMHYQLNPNCQGKLVSVNKGKIFDAVVDIRKGSPTFGKWAGFELSEENRHVLYVPEGFAHGFVVLSDSADVTYKCTSGYVPDSARVFRFDDPEIGIEWPVEPLVMSLADKEAPLFKDAEYNFVWQPPKEEEQE